MRGEGGGGRKEGREGWEEGGGKVGRVGGGGREGGKGGRMVETKKTHLLVKPHPCKH